MLYNFNRNSNKLVSKTAPTDNSGVEIDKDNAVSTREIHFKTVREWRGGQGWGSCAKTSSGTQNMNVKSRLIPRHFFPKSIYCRAVCPRGWGKGWQQWEGRKGGKWTELLPCNHGASLNRGDATGAHCACADTQREYYAEVYSKLSFKLKYWN